MDSAVKAGFVRPGSAGVLKMGEALAMVVRAYEVKTGIKAPPVQEGGLAPGVASLDAGLRARVQFAFDNGIAEPVCGGTLNPDRNAARGEMAVFVELMLELAGLA